MNTSTISSPQNAAIGDTIGTLDSILNPNINIAIVQRSVDHFAGELQTLLEQDVSVKATGTTSEVLAVLETHLSQIGQGDSTVLGDIEYLLHTFQYITKAKSFRLLLTTIHTNMCRKFHSDINDLRMLCTYVGEGTLWVAESSHLGDTFLKRDEKGGVTPHPESIRQANAGDVLVLKGALYSNGQPVIHKSPAIERNGGARLLVRIDTNESCL